MRIYGKVDGLIDGHACAANGFKFIYALVDTRNGLPRYVGSTGDTAARMQQHLRLSVHGDSLKDRWIRGMMCAGMVPTMRILQIADKWSACFEEARWTKSLNDEAILLNEANGHAPKVEIGYELRYLLERIASVDFS